MLSFRQIFAAVTVEQRLEGADQPAQPVAEPQTLDASQLAFVSGGKLESIPVGGW